MPSHRSEIHPAIIIVHGNGSATRYDYNSLIEIFLRNGYAVLFWDKPGYGESTGKFRDVITQRATILANGVEVLIEHPAIEPTRKGF